MAVMVAPPEAYAISEAEFQRVRALVMDLTGIKLGPEKKALVVGRLSSRLRARELATFTQYLKLLQDPKERDEVQMAVDRITTNETSFFREPGHFDVMRQYIDGLRPIPSPFRVWSAASSSGEEAYSIAMALSDKLGPRPWEILGTDISTRVLERARKGLYPMEDAAQIPKDFLHRYCLKGSGRHAGMFLIDRPLRERATFRQANLTKALPDMGLFDLIFLRNVLIYFDAEQKRRVVEGLLRFMKPQSLLLIGHSESLNGITDRFVSLRPTVYRVA